MKHNKIWDFVQSCMKNDFAISTAELPAYACVHQASTFSGNHIDLIRVFKKEDGHPHSIKTYDDLDRHPDLVQFKGHIFKDGGLCLSNKECGLDSENDSTRKEVVHFPY